jgi:ORF6N domain-containing protein
MPRTTRSTLTRWPLDGIRGRIFVVRGFKVLLDSDLAGLYGVETRRLNEQVRRNRERFPADFLIELTEKETENLISQNATSSWGGRRKRPFAFTEHGAIMAASVLNAPRAVEMSVFVVRAFVSLRETIAGHRELKQQLETLERHVGKKFSEHDEAISAIVRAIRELMDPPPTKKRPIGFVTR